MPVVSYIRPATASPDAAVCTSWYIAAYRSLGFGLARAWMSAEVELFVTYNAPTCAVREMSSL